MELSGYTVIVTSHTPNACLSSFLNEIKECGFTRAFLDGDGSSETSDTIADRNDESAGIILIDFDGLYTAADAVKIAQEMSNNPHAVVLGQRTYPRTGFSVLAGLNNRFMRLIFKLLYGNFIPDIRTGILGIPAVHAKKFTSCTGHHEVYRMNILISAASHKIPITFAVIDSSGLNGFSKKAAAVRETAAVYWALGKSFIKYTFSSNLAFLVDIGLFTILVNVTREIPASNKILFATAFARAGSCIFNYFVNKNLVFNNKESHTKLFIEYSILAVMKMLCSAGFVIAFSALTKQNEVLLKMLIDTMLFFVSYRIQNKYIFNRK